MLIAQILIVSSTHIIFLFTFSLFKELRQSQAVYALLLP